MPLRLYFRSQGFRLVLLCIFILHATVTHFYCNKNDHVLDVDPRNATFTETPKQRAQLLCKHLDTQFWLQYAQHDALRHGASMSQQCDGIQGSAWLAKYASSLSHVCGSGDSGSIAVCYAYPKENRGLTCWTKNMLLDAHAFLGKSVTSGQPDHHKFLPIGGAGSVRLSCNMSRLNGSQNLVYDRLPWFKHAYTMTTNKEIQASCVDAIEYPVMFVSRLDPTNPYHHTQTLVQTFLSLAIVNAYKTHSFKHLQVILADHFPLGPFIDLWNRISQPYGVTTLSSKFLKTPTCFRESIQAHYCSPGDSFLGLEGIGSEHACPSTVLMAIAHWQRYLYSELLPLEERLEYEHAVQNRTQNSTETHHRRLNVVWLSRQWFGKSMQAGGGLTGWQAQRQLPPSTENRIVSAMQQTVSDWNDAACAPAVFGWWQKKRPPELPQGCKPTNVSFDFHVSSLTFTRNTSILTPRNICHRLLNLVF